MLIRPYICYLVPAPQLIGSARHSPCVIIHSNTRTGKWHISTHVLCTEGGGDARSERCSKIVQIQSYNLVFHVIKCEMGGPLLFLTASFTKPIVATQTDKSVQITMKSMFCKYLSLSGWNVTFETHNEGKINASSRLYLCYNINRTLTRHFLCLFSCTKVTTMQL